MKTAKEFDDLFDNGDDISEFVDYSKGYRPNLTQKRVNLDLPIWVFSPTPRKSNLKLENYLILRLLHNL